MVKMGTLREREKKGYIRGLGISTRVQSRGVGDETNGRETVAVGLIRFQFQEISTFFFFFFFLKVVVERERCG